ncbi:MAG: hypothetical protein ACRDYE_04250 [Acidimicrobiales bacterium]
MSTHEPTPDSRQRARQATLERVAEWSPERSFDMGDSHDKGEPSLCVGEAA